MPKLRDVIEHLILYLPQYTDKFSEQIPITSLIPIPATPSGTFVTATSTIPHPFTTGEMVNIVGATSPLPVTLTRIDNLVTGVTPTPHDLTLNYNGKIPLISLQCVVEIEGADQTDYNGEWNVVAIPDRNTFVFDIGTLTPATPATGTITMNDFADRGYLGLHTITVVDPSTFTFTVPEELTTQAGGEIEAHYNFRISGGATIERCIAAYSKQITDNYWAFVVNNETQVNKGREIANDPTYINEDGTYYLQMLIDRLQFYVVANSNKRPTDLAGRNVRDDMEDVRPDIFRTMLGVPWTFGLSNDFDAQEKGRANSTYLGDSFFEYNRAYYLHEFNFEIISYIDRRDVFFDKQNVAFREIDLDIKGSINGIITPSLTDEIDLTDFPEML